MMTTSTLLHAYIRRGLRQGAAFFSPIAWAWHHLARTLGFTILASAAGAAELLVLQPGGGGTPNAGNAQVWRFDASTAAALGSFGYDNEGFYAMSVSPENEVFVTSNILGGYDLYRFNRVGVYRGVTAAQTFGDFTGVTRGADGNLFSIMRRGDWSGNPEQPLFVARLDQPGGTTFIANGTGGMNHPTWMVRGPDQQLYVLDPEVGILRFNGATGAWLGVFVPLGRGGLSTPQRMVFGPDGHCYVSTGTGNSVLRFDGASGAFVDQFVATGSGGLDDARGLAVGPDGQLYVSSRNTHRVLRYHGTTGAYLDVAAVNSDLRYPTDIAFVAGTPVDTVWFDDALPAGAVPATSHGGPWTWVDNNPTPLGTKAHRSFTAFTSSPSGLVEHSFNFASETMQVGVGDSLFVHVYLHSDAYGDREIMLSWCDGSWEHRAYWGGNAINAGTNGTAGRRYLGALPRSTGWFRLEVPASLVGLEGARVQGMSFSTYNLPVTFDLVGKTSHAASPVDTTPPTVQLTAPAAGATVSGQVSITADARDNVQLASVQFLVNGTSLAGRGTATNPLWSAWWDTQIIANGTYSLTVVATDTAGNRTTTPARSVTVNNATTEPTPTYWVDDAMPPGAWGGGSGGDGWNWVTTSPAPFVGTRAHQSNLASGFHEHYFNEAAPPLAVGENDLLIAHVFVDPANPPSEIMLSWFDGSSWEHRAYWGADQIGYGVNNTVSRRYVGPRPATGSWIRIAVPASQVGLAGRSIYGMGFAAYGGRVTWDGVGKIAATNDVAPPTVTITSPANGATVQGNVTLAVTANDNVRVNTVALLVDEVFHQAVQSSPYQFQWDSTHVANGTHTLRVRAGDVNGNSGEHAITVTVNNTATDLPPTLQFTSPATNAQVFGTVSVAVDAADDRGVAAVEFRIGSQAPVRVTAPPYAISWDTRTSRSEGVTIYAQVTDTAGQQVSDFRHVSVNHAASGDTTAPTLSINSPAPGATLSGIVTVALDAADNYGLAEINIFGNANTLGRLTTAPWSLSWNTQNMSDGPVRLRVEARDLAGNLTTREINVTIANGTPDHTPPTVAFTSPGNDTTVSGNVTVTASASDNEGVSSVQFSLDGVALQPPDTAAPYSFSWNTAGVSDGTHVLSAVATDTAGNASTRVAITVHVNNAAPPGVDTPWFDDAIPAGASSGGNGGDGWNWVTSNPAPKSGSRAHQSNIAAGLHEHYIDWANSSAFPVAAGDTLFAWVYLDPANMPQEIMLSWRDGSNWEHRAYWGANLIGYGTNGTASRRSMGALPAAGVWTKLTVPASSVGLGSSALIGMSFSAFGGRVTWDATGKVGGGGGDTSPPTTIVTFPDPGATLSGSVTLTTTPSDNVGIARIDFAVDGVVVGSPGGPNAGGPYMPSQPLNGGTSFSITWNSATVANGTHVITAIAYDAAGNRGTSPGVTVTVNNSSTTPADTTPPTVSIAAPAANAVVSGNAVRLSALAGDNQAVASVRFRIDGADIGSPDTIAPFSFDWNSTTAANGSHAVTAVATDTAGNQTTSGTVIFSVNNAGTTTPGAVIWMDSAVPPDAVTGSSGGDTWNWVTTNPTPFAGTRVHQSAIAAGVHDHFFVNSTSRFAIFTGDTIFAYVYLDPANVPSEIMLSFNDGTWEHRAYWGSNVITYGQDGTNSRRYIGPIPAGGQWVRLEVPARLVGLEGRMINGVSFTLVGGRATWDIVGKVSP